MFRTWFAVLAATMMVSACQAPMDLPQVENRKPLDVSIADKTATIAFAGALSKIPRGTTIAAFPDVGGPMSLTCGVGGSISLEWGGRLAQAWSGEIAEIFYDTMKGAGYDVTGNPSALFERGKDRTRAHAKVGARLVDVRGNFCDEVSFWTGRQSNRIMGEMYVKVEWEVYSEADRRVVGNFVSEGRYRMHEPAGDGAALAMFGAFSAAAANLAADPDYFKLLSDLADPGAKAERGDASALSVSGAMPSQRKIADNLDRILDATVTIRLADGHGSGFFVSYDGYGLTNAHVAGEAETVAVRLRSGVEVEARVLRVDKSRDVALFKAPIQILHPLPLTPNSGLSRLDEVYAVGTPLDLGLQSTVTKGVVSSFRQTDERGRPISYIQSDVAVSPGNSGGPLLDAKGNVVGITVAGFTATGAQVGLNLFISLASALDTLHLTVDPQRRE